MEQMKIEQIKTLLEKRKEHLLQIKRDKENALVTAPRGTLRVSGHDNKIQYYQRNDPKDFNGTYIREKDIHLAQGLAQKDYDQKVLRFIEQELNAINKYLSNYPMTYAEQIYEKLHKERRVLVEPIVEPEEQYVDKWEAVPYQGKGFSEDI